MFEPFAEVVEEFQIEGTTVPLAAVVHRGPTNSVYRRLIFPLSERDGFQHCGHLNCLQRMHQDFEMSLN